jgi:hypothetical protein
VLVHHAVEALILLGEGGEILDGTQVVADGQVTAGLNAGKGNGCILEHRFILTFGGENGQRGFLKKAPLDSPKTFKYVDHVFCFGTVIPKENESPTELDFSVGDEFTKIRGTTHD